MREIKFRAWDKETNGWLEGVTYTLHTSGRLITLPINVELMQYTGLKDCKGKEIYESDIVSYEYENVTGWHKQKRVVRWNDKAAAFEVPVANPWTRNIKVIGNIYEHPEVVKHDPQP